MRNRYQLLATMKTHFQSCLPEGISAWHGVSSHTPSAFRQGWCLGDKKPELPSDFSGQKTTAIPGITAFRVLASLCQSQQFGLPQACCPWLADAWFLSVFTCGPSLVSLPLLGTLTLFLQGPDFVLSSTLDDTFSVSASEHNCILRSWGFWLLDMNLEGTQLSSWRPWARTGKSWTHLPCLEILDTGDQRPLTFLHRRDIPASRG